MLHFAHKWMIYNKIICENVITFGCSFITFCKSSICDQSVTIITFCCTKVMLFTFCCIITFCCSITFCCIITFCCSITFCCIIIFCCSITFCCVTIYSFQQNFNYLTRSYNIYIIISFHRQIYTFSKIKTKLKRLNKSILSIKSQTPWLFTYADNIIIYLSCRWIFQDKLSSMVVLGQIYQFAKLWISSNTEGGFQIWTTI